MKKLTTLFLLFILCSTSFSNWTGPTLQERKEQVIQRKIAYLYKNYPPNETGWMYEISLRIKNQN
jgi:hypothetical protein